MDTPCVFIKSRKGTDQLFLDSFLYNLNKKSEDNFYWSCIRKGSSKCAAAVKTKKVGEHHYIQHKNCIEHMHEPEHDIAQSSVLRNSLKKKAADSFDSPGQIIQKVIQEVPNKVAPYMPTKRAMRMVIHRERVRTEPPLPKSLNSFTVPDQYTVVGSEQFLIGHYIDNDKENESILVFSTGRNLRLLNNSKFWIVDGTFKCCPNLFCQIFTLHGMVGSENGTQKILPLAYGLLSGKSENSYFIFFELIRIYCKNNFNLDLKPEIIISDFEQAIIKASLRVFPNSIHKCCFFHLSQSIWKHIQKAGLSKKYTNDSEFAHKMRHILALAYLKPEDIPAAFELIRREVLPNESKEVADWFSKYYVNGTYTSTRSQSSPDKPKSVIKKKPPLFPPGLWSVLDCFVAGIPITQNAVESWNNRWNSLLNRKKINIYKTLKEFVKEQKNTEYEIERFAGVLEKKERAKTQYYKKLKEHINLKGDMDMLTYLDGLAYICYIKK